MNTNAATKIRNTLYAPAMRFRDFRFLFVSAVFESVGFMGEQVVIGWLMLELTNSPFMVGAIIGLRMAPFFFLGLIAGTISDMVDRRNLMRVLNFGMIIVSMAVGLLIWSDLLQVWHLFVFTLVGGSIAAMYQTLRQSFAHDVVGSSNLLSGLSYVSLGMRIGGLAGSLAVGFLIGGIGPEAAYFLLASCYLMSIVWLSFIRSAKPSSTSERQSVWQGLKEFFVAAMQNNAMLVLVFIVIATEIFGFSFNAIMPSIAKDVLEVGPEGLGALNAARSAGAIVIIFLLSFFGEMGRKGLMLIGVVLLFGISLMLLGQTSTFIIAAVIVGVIGGMMGLTDLFAQSLLQNVVPDNLRGRAMGAWVVGVGTAPAGTLQVGWIASAFGVSVALMANGLGLIVIGLLILLLYPKLRRL